MKYLLLLLLLITFTAHAQIKSEVTPNKAGLAGYSLEAKDQADLEKQYKRLYKKSKWLKFKENKKKKDALFSITTTNTEYIDNGKTKVVVNEDGSVSDAIDYDEVVTTATNYYHPRNFKVKHTNMTAEIAAKAAEKQARKEEIQEIKAMIQDIAKSGLPTWHKKILRRTVKELKE